jgi:uncharacterized protein (TIGR03083 family)
MTVAGHLEGLREAMLAFVRHADRAGLRAPVPTTPDWTVRALVAHQGMVHRWAAATVAGRAVPGSGPGSAEAWEQEGRVSPDPLEWLRDGAIELVQALVAAPADLDALVFLADAPPPREFWARRQCHETTIHAVDAVAASLGRMPVAADTPWITDEIALDGIDELLTGFLPRRRSRVRSPEPRRIVVRAGGRAWQVAVSEEPPVTTRLGPDADVDTDIEIAGDPVAVHLTLWNRSDELAPTDGWDLWRDGSPVRWG